MTLKKPLRSPFERAPRAAVGWGDLLAFARHEIDLTQRAEAARLLGLPALSADVFAHLKSAQEPKPPKRPKAVNQATAIAAARRVPLTCPQLLYARAIKTPEDQGPSAQSAPLPEWTASQADEVEAMLEPTGLSQRLPPCLWPLGATCKDVRAASLLPRGLLLDLPRLVERMSGAQWPYPFPRRPRRARGRHLVLLMDWREDLTLFKTDFLRLYRYLRHQLHGVGVEYDSLLDGPYGVLSSQGTGAARRAWTSETTVVLVSDLGGDNPRLASQWGRYVRGLRKTVGAVLVLDPLQTQTRQPVSQVSDLQVETLLSALSPAITVEPALIRAMRLAVVPDSTAALEVAVWRHPDLEGALPFRQWKLREQSHWLYRLQQQPASLRAKVAQTLHTFHDHVCTLQRDDEWTLWDRVADEEVRRLSAEKIGSCPETTGAMERGEMVARHLYSLSCDGNLLDVDRQGKQLSTGLVALKARERLERFVSPASEISPVALRCLLGAAAMGTEPLELPPNTASPPELLNQSGDTGLVLLYQIGCAVWIVRQASDWGGYLGVGYPEGKKQAELEFIQKTKTRLVQAVVDGAWLEWKGLSGAKLLKLGSLYGPVKLDEWTGELQKTMRLNWRGGGVDILPVDRVRGAAAWGVRASERDLAEPSVIINGLLDGRPQILNGDELHVFSKEDSFGVARHRLVTTGIAVAVVGDGARDSFGVGVDEYGAYLRWVLTAPLRGSAAQRGQGTRRHGEVSLRFRYLPPGTFLMGSPDGEGASNEHPQHTVTLTEGFWMAEVPCTQALWQAVMGNNPSHFEDGADAPQHPVENVSFDDVTQFLKKLTVLLPDGVEAALPTEAQWEYACRAGTQTAYWWGDDFDPARANVDHADNKRLDSKEGTTPVNRYPPNPWGLYDMHGNVWEWCADYPRGYREYPIEAVVNPTGAVESFAHAVRGGSWVPHHDYARAAFRDKWPSDNCFHFLGFRLVLRSSSLGPEGPV